jgi:hypothetical protein
MDISSIEQHMDRFGSRIQLEYETQNYDGVRIKTGTISGGPPHTVLLYGMLWNWFSVEIIVPDIVPVFIRTPS